MSSSSPQAPERLPRLTYKVGEVADALGVTDETVRRWITEGRVQASRIGREYLIRAAELERLLQEGAQ
jgi:excisionase family DNA binding protein